MVRDLHRIFFFSLIQVPFLLLKCYATCWGNCLSRMWFMCFPTFSFALEMETNMSERYTQILSSSTVYAVFSSLFLFMSFPYLSISPGSWWLCQSCNAQSKCSWSKVSFALSSCSPRGRVLEDKSRWVFTQHLPFSCAWSNLQSSLKVLERHAFVYLFKVWDKRKKTRQLIRIVDFVPDI